MSVSRKQCWQTCKYQYKYRYHLELANDAAEPIYFTYGSIIHKIAEEYVGAKGERLISEVANDVLHGRIELEPGVVAPQLPAEYKRKIPEHLNAIAKLTEQTGFEGHVEYDFRFDLDPPNERYAVGFIDRIIQKDDKFWIIDYKTTKKGWWRKGPKDIINDLQLRVYARVIQRDFGAKAENIKTALFYLEGSELVGASFSEQSLKQAEEELLKAYIEIQNASPDEVQGSVGNHCNRCDYKKLCPFFTHSENYLKKLGLD